MKITYLFESTTLWGGNKVALEQAEVLSDSGHSVTILSKDAGPDWYQLRLPVIQVPAFNATTIPESDIIVGTYWPTVKDAYESGRGKVVHLCQGYEGGNIELAPVKEAIDAVYAYKIPKLTVSPHLSKFLEEHFSAETYYIGSMLNRDIFYPAPQHDADIGTGPFSVLVGGPFEADVKNIAVALRGILLARKIPGIPLKLVRVSQFPLSGAEARILEPDEYRFHVPFLQMGEIYRRADVLISVSKEAEGFGLPALEAMACGVPVILSNISSYRGFDEHKDYAIFVDPLDHEAVAAAIERVWSDEVLREKLVRRGLSVAGNFTKEKVRERLIAALEEILLS